MRNNDIRFSKTLEHFLIRKKFFATTSCWLNRAVTVLDYDILKRPSYNKSLDFSHKSIKGLFVRSCGHEYHQNTLPMYTAFG